MLTSKAIRKKEECIPFEQVKRARIWTMNMASNRVRHTLFGIGRESAQLSIDAKGIGKSKRPYWLGEKKDLLSKMPMARIFSRGDSLNELLRRDIVFQLQKSVNEAEVT